MLKLLLIMQLAWAPQNQHIANAISNWEVGTAIGLDTFQILRHSNKWCMVEYQVERLGLTIGLSEIVKRVVHKERPDHSDNMSFWSEHTAITAASGGWKIGWTIPLTVGTGYMRVAANKHDVVDVVVGGIAGTVIGLRQCRKQ